MVKVVRQPSGSSVRPVYVIDWYKKAATRSVPRQSSLNTEIGELVSQAKYWKNSQAARERAQEELGVRLTRAAEVIRGRGPIDCIVGVPGSTDDPECCSMRLARDVAEALGIPLAAPRNGRGRHDSVKNHRPAVGNGYVIGEDLSRARILIIDDVYNSGETIRRVARAAGARHARGLAAARARG